MRSIRTMKIHFVSEKTNVFNKQILIINCNCYEQKQPKQYIIQLSYIKKTDTGNYALQSSIYTSIIIFIRFSKAMLHVS